MILAQKALIKHNHWLTIIAISTIVSLTNCNCGQGGMEDPFMEKWNMLNSNTPGTTQTSEDGDTEATSKKFEKMVTELFASLETLPSQSAEQKEADKKAIQRYIENLSKKEKIILEYYIEAVDMEQDSFIDLFADVKEGKDFFKRMLIPHIKASLLVMTSKGISPDYMEKAIIKKRNGILLSEQEYIEFFSTKEAIQKFYITNLKKAAAAQAKNK